RYRRGSHAPPGGPMPTARRPSRFRLPADVRPTRYDLHLEPDLEGGGFRGEVRIALRLARPRAEIVLHAAELAIERAVAHTDGREMPARVRLSRADETAALRFARPLAAGEATLALRFSGRLNQHLRGLYAASADGSRYAFSQCEAADARRAGEIEVRGPWVTAAYYREDAPEKFHDGWLR